MNCERMLTAVDTNVLIDVLEADPEFGEASCKAFMKASNEGELLVCDVVWAELFTLYNEQENALRERLSMMQVEFSPLTKNHLKSQPVTGISTVPGQGAADGLPLIFS